jgi:hypothetical protein
MENCYGQKAKKRDLNKCNDLQNLVFQTTIKQMVYKKKDCTTVSALPSHKQR